MLDEQPTSLPVDDAFAVEEEEAIRYLCTIKPGGGERRRVRERDSLLADFSFRKLAQGFSARSEGMELERLMKGRVTNR